jgi:Fur family transcriptional regulator, ferric uptake regulator
MESISELETLFARKELRLTTPRRAVFSALYASNHPMMVGEVIKACANTDRVSIYRSIELFVGLNIIEVVPMGWKQRYELTSPFRPHHHHLYCTNCGALTDIHSQKLELLVAAVTKEHGFIPAEHKFEVSGICKKCQATRQEA